MGAQNKSAKLRRKNGFFKGCEQIGDPSPGKITTSGANPASDGIVNLIKYALNLDPLVAQTSSLPAFSVTGNLHPQFTFQRNLQATDTTLNVEACNDLTKPSGDPDGWQTIASLPTGASSWTTSGGSTVSDNGGVVIVTDGAPINAHTLRFFRLQVTLPLACVSQTASTNTRNRIRFWCAVFFIGHPGTADLPRRV